MDNLPIYFLSIVLNGLVGFLFIFGDSQENGSSKVNAKFSFGSDGFRLLLGILAMVVGILKLLLPVKVFFLGDLLPALAGIVAGFVIIYGFYRERASSTADNGSFRETLLYHKKVVGIGLLVVAVLHFLFYRALFL